KMAMGYLDPSFSPIKQLLGEIGLAWLASLIMFGTYSVLSSFIYGFRGFSSLFLQLMFTNLIAIPSIILISLTVAIVTRKRGWDPDNFLIPVETSLADDLTTISLLSSIKTIVA
ncbi:MAG: magnesium transporter, partial [Candidatus Bathyarchaeia archaeon]